MRTKVTLVLLFLNVALFFFIFKFERQWMTDPRARDARTRVLGPEAADIRSLEIKRSTPGAPTIALARRGETWWLTQPFEWPANAPAAVSIVHELQLLDEVTHFNTKDLANNSMSLADYGLDQPKLTVSFSSGDAPPTLLRIGDSTNIGNRLYVLSPDGERIHVVPRTLADNLSLSLEQLRADTLLTIPVFEARALSVQLVSSPRLRIRRENNAWLFDTILNNARAGKTAIDLAISALNALRVKTFAPAVPPATLPSAAPTLRVTLEGNNRRETLLLGEPVPAPTTPLPPPATPSSETEYYAQLEGRTALFTVTIPAKLLDTLRNAQVALREKRLLEFDPLAVTALTLTAPNQPPLTLQRLDAGATATDATWQIVRRGAAATGPQTLPADRAAVQRLLEQLALLSAKDPGGFMSDAPSNADLENWGFNRPEREVTLTLASPSSGTPPTVPLLSSSSTTLQLGTDANNALYARLDPATQPKGSVYAVTLDLARELSVTPRDWRERALPALPPTARITALKLTRLTDNTTLLDVALDDSGNPKSKIENQKPLDTLLAQVRAPRAKTFVRETFADRVTVAGDDRPWSYQLDATISLPGGTGAEQTSVRTLLFTERVGGAQQLAGSREFDAIFEIEQPLLDVLWTLTYGPRDPGPAAPEPTKR